VSPWNYIARHGAGISGVQHPSAFTEREHPFLPEQDVYHTPEETPTTLGTNPERRAGGRHPISNNPVYLRRNQAGVPRSLARPCCVARRGTTRTLWRRGSDWRYDTLFFSFQSLGPWLPCAGDWTIIHVQCYPHVSSIDRRILLIRLRKVA